jgi:hypothetical protein
MAKDAVLSKTTMPKEFNATTSVLVVMPPSKLSHRSKTITFWAFRQYRQTFFQNFADLS